MCSICGMIDFKHKEKVDAVLVEKMGQKMGHRGPDQKDTYHNEVVAFQHNRLAIMDVEKGLQPMQRTYQGKTYTIVYNGEIYNGPELRKVIEAEGITLTTQCDTEVVLYTYIMYGEACASKLNGIFAFAVYDDAADEVYLARDRFGIKPFFYTQVGTTLLFASEVKALLAHPQVKPTVGREGLWQLLYLAPNKMVGTSVFKNIHEIKPAYHGYYKGEKLTLTPYWELRAWTFEGDREEAIATTRALVTDAIDKQLVSDVPLCTFLSGGLDSSIISSVAAKKYAAEGGRLHTYSFEYEGNKESFGSTLFQPQKDDDYAVYLAEVLGTEHHILTATNDAISSLLREATYYRDLPGMADIDSSLLYYCGEVKQLHTVALSGECADEVFGGYPWFYRKEMLERDFFPWIHDPTKRASLFRSDVVRGEEGYAFMKDVYREAVAGCPLLDTDSPTMHQSRIGTWLSTQYFMTSLLERKDRMSMGRGVEVRVPFADHRILEYVFNVPWEIKFEGGVEKALLRNAMADYLPDKILNRKKSPYPKTHNPVYEQMVVAMLRERLQDKESILSQLIDRKEVEGLMTCGNVTWFGQLMSKPQLIAWLIQLDEWFKRYGIVLELD